MSELGFECQIQHLDKKLCDGPRMYVPRYFRNGRHLYACGHHAAVRTEMGPGLSFRPVETAKRKGSENPRRRAP